MIVGALVMPETMLGALHSACNSAAFKPGETHGCL
jgi:hypothetical protein